MFLIAISVLLFSIICHELAHGYTAYLFGDKTAYHRGRLTFNPIKHLDPIGSFLLPMLMFISGSSFIFGWAKPVPINPSNLPHPRKNLMLIGAAGPLTNFVLALIASALYKTGVGSLLDSLLGTGIFSLIFQLLVVYNVILGIFNLIPIPPLDGSRIINGLLPLHLSWKYEKLESYGIAIIFLLFYLGLFRFIFVFIRPILEFLLG